MESKDIFIGRLIKGRMEELRLSPTEFAKRLGYSLPGATNILKRKTMQTDVLQLVCKVLDYDFFKYYSEPVNLVTKVESEEADVLRKELTACQRVNEDLRKEMGYLKKIVGLYEGKGKD